MSDDNRRDAADTHEAHDDAHDGGNADGHVADGHDDDHVGDDTLDAPADEHADGHVADGHDAGGAHEAGAPAVGVGGDPLTDGVSLVVARAVGDAGAGTLTARAVDGAVVGVDGRLQTPPAADDGRWLAVVASDSRVGGATVTVAVELPAGGVSRLVDTLDTPTDPLAPWVEPADGARVTVADGVTATGATFAAGRVTVAPDPQAPAGATEISLASPQRPASRRGRATVRLSGEARQQLADRLRAADRGDPP